MTAVLGRRRLLAVALLATTLGCSSSPAPTTSSSTPTEHACSTPRVKPDVAYVAGGDPLQRLDLYRPLGACRAVPLVVWVHGGGWSVGDKRGSITDKVALWNEAGWAVASLNYRLTDVSVPPDQRIVAPTHDEDVAAAIAFLVNHSPDLGIDAKHIALLGHSAGAAIVAALASDPAYLGAHGLAPADLTCVGPLDTEGFDVARAVAGGDLAGVYRGAFGDDPALWHELSPLTHLGEASVPHLFLVTRGEPDRRAATADFASAARAAGAHVTVQDLPGFSHEDVNRRIGDPTDHVLTPALEQYLSGCLSTAAP